MMNMEKIYIGRLSKLTGISTKTIRYYEDFGLLKRPARAVSNYRLYGQSDIEKLLFIKKAKELGLTLTEIKKIIRCSEKGLHICCAFVKDVFTQKVKEYEAKINELHKLRNKLKEKLKNWIKPHRVRKRDYSICPQIEKNGRRERK